MQVLAEGVPEGMALVMGAWCGRKPTGPLVEAVEKAGDVRWIPLPPPPKPWEDAVLSSEQRRCSRPSFAAPPAVSYSARGANRLLLERLGFAPRLLVVQEVRKLAGAAGEIEVDEALVRRLTFPRERSLEVVRDAVLGRELEPLLDLVAAAASGVPGQRLAGSATRSRWIRTDPLRSGDESPAPDALSQPDGSGRAASSRELNPEQTSRPAGTANDSKTTSPPSSGRELKEDAPSPMVRPGGKAADTLFPRCASSRAPADTRTVS